MKATLIVIENDKDHVQAKALVEELKLRERFDISADLLIAPRRSRGLVA